MINDPLSDIHQYSPTFTITQLIKFCEKKALPVTRAMIQNYIRDGLLPPPIKRLYTQKHLAALAMICRLKTVWDIPTIKDALAPHMDDEGLCLDLYKWFMERQKETLNLWVSKVAPAISTKEEDRQDLLLMAHATDIKNLLKG
ncbi:MAG: DUF1836 domain-containing protein [Defluviitaleaceae bacterium]|nr:DUF1836 domain-containing protein [Defluviitaleaceae bacterium]